MLPSPDVGGCIGHSTGMDGGYAGLHFGARARRINRAKANTKVGHISNGIKGTGNARQVKAQCACAGLQELGS